jgi:ER membrane protein complex subunit 1
VSSSPSGIQYVSLHSTLLKGFKLKVTSLHPKTKRQASQYSLSSDSEVSSVESVIFVGANTAAPLIVWTDKGYKTLKINVIGSKNVQSINIDNDAGEDIEKVVVHAPQSPTALPHFLVHYQTASQDWAEVYHINLKSSAVSKAYSLPKLRGSGGTFSTSTIDANVYFTRITQSEVSLVSSASHGLLGRWKMALKYSDSAHAVSEVVARGKTEFAVRFGLVADGTWVLIRNGDVVWTRPEDLAGAVAAAWVDLDQGPSLKQELEIEGHSNIVAAYIHRVRRHAHDLQHLPEWIMGLPQKVMTSFGDSKPSSSFGFNKIVLVGTASGRVMALDAANGGKILWNSNIVSKSSTTHITAITVDGSEATVYEDDGTMVKLGFTQESDEFKASFLQVIDGGSRPRGFVSLPGSPHLVPIQSNGSPAATTGAKGGIVVTQSDDGRAIGWKMGATPSTVWEFQPPSGHRILSIVARPPHDPVASAGKVLGDRSVMYKYLNPNLALITTATASSLTIHLLDSISGRVLHSTTHSGVDTSLPIPAVISENWFAYSFFADPKTPSAAKGNRLVISELYESPIANDRGPLGPASTFSSLDPGNAPTPHVLSQSFIIPTLISHMSVTQSRQGITLRQILCVLPTENAIIGIPRPWIDPRRPVDRDPTPNEIEEGLFKYNPVLDFDGKWYLSHAREVRGIKDVVATPSLLESTSLVFGWGGDVFGTRVAPSGAFDVLGKEFSKVQLVVTVFALSLGVGILGPMVSFFFPFHSFIEVYQPIDLLSIKL